MPWKENCLPPCLYKISVLDEHSAEFSPDGSERERHLSVGEQGRQYLNLAVLFLMLSDYSLSFS